MVTENIYYDLHGVVNSLLSSLDGICVSAGLAPADAPCGSIFTRLDRISANDSDGCTVSLKLRYFPHKGYTGGGTEIYSLLKNITLGGVDHPAKKYECSLNASHLDITVTYDLPMTYVAYADGGDEGEYMSFIETRVTLK